MRLGHAAADEIANRAPLPVHGFFSRARPWTGLSCTRRSKRVVPLSFQKIVPWGVVQLERMSSVMTIRSRTSRKYAAETIGPRTPARQTHAVIVNLLDDVDAVVVSLPPRTPRSVGTTRVASFAAEEGNSAHPLAQRLLWPCFRRDEERLDMLMDAAPLRTEARRG
jgi:hypothetical protein